MEKTIHMPLEPWNREHLDRIAICEMKEIMSGLSLYMNMVHKKAEQVDDKLHSCGKGIAIQMNRIVRSLEVIHLKSYQKLELQKSDVDLMKLIVMESHQWRDHIEKEKISFSVTGDHALVSGDEALLRLMIENILCHVLYNLQKNGTVKVHVQKTNRAVLQIIDNGYEISERDMALLMGEKTLHDGPEHIGNATGIALAATGIIARAHDVRIEVRKSNPQEGGRGTCYMFVFPESEEEKTI